MAYSSITKPTDYFNTVLYTGDGATSTAGTLARTISGVGFQPDWVWVKGRTSGGFDSHGLHDVVRTAPKWLRSDGTDVEADVTTGFNSGGVGSFTSDGFGIFSGTTGATTNYNTSSTTYVAWNWLAGGSASSNSDGSVTTSVSANTTAGFSIVSYTGTGSVSTFGHGLGAKPNVMIQKKRSGSAAWTVYHDKVDANPSHKYLYLNSTAAVADYADHFNDTEPTSSVFTLGTDTSVNGSSATNIMYCFTEKQGYSKFGSYTGNGSTDGTFVYTGFKPAWVLIKKTSGNDDWALFDNKRDVDNVTEHLLRANTNAAEEVHANFKIDLLSNGFKLKTTDGKMNGSSATYIYMAFAENPFVGNDSGTAVPVTAR